MQNKKIPFLSLRAQYAIFAFIFFTTIIYFSYNILLDANWVFGDDYQFFVNTAIGKPFIFYTIHPLTLRFAPLAFSDFNILLLFSELPSAYAHFIWVTVTFIIFAAFYAFFLIQLEKENRFSYSVLLIPVYFFSLFYIKFFMGIYMELIFFERMLVLFFLLFSMCYYYALKKDSLTYYLCAACFAFCATYFKEPVFGAFLIIPLFTYLFHRTTLTRNHKIFNCLLICNAIIFLLTFYFAAYIHFVEGHHAEGMFFGSRFDLVQKIFIAEKTLIAGFLVGLVRAFFLLFRGRQEKYLFFDATLFMGLAYLCAFIIFKIHWRYYFFPSIVLFIPSFFYWTLQAHQRAKWLPACIALLVLLIPTCYFEDQFSLMEDQHALRKTFVPRMEPLIQLYHEGAQLVYVEQPIVNTENFFARRKRRFQKIAFLEAVAFLLQKDKDGVKYERTVSELHADIIDAKTIVLYPVQNNIEQDMHPVTKELLEKHFELPVEIPDSSIQIYYPRTN